MIPAYNKKCAAFPFETGIHFRRKTDFFPEEDTTMSYSGFEPEPPRLHAEGHSHHTGWAICIIAFLLRERKGVLLEVAKELGVEVNITLTQMELKKRICQSKYYNDKVAKCLLEGILEEKREVKKLEEREKLEIKEFAERRLELGNLRNRTAEVSEPVSKYRPLINPIVNKSVENATSCDFEKENCDPQSSDCEVKVKAGVFERNVRAVAICVQRVINTDEIGVGSLELIENKGVVNPETLICENNCEEKYTIGTLTGGDEQLTVDRESFRNHIMAKIVGQLNGEKKNMCKADVREGLGDRKEQRGIMGHCTGFVEVVFLSFSHNELSEETREEPGMERARGDSERKETWTVEDRDWSGKKGEKMNAGGVGKLE
ncbi:uncharacterized protein TNCV_540751 [Trichonephila clavipes]|nr:uncharacterized protein TNCV_540751 [Trichonephila clavipes]